MKEIILILILVGLVVLSGIQAVQINELRGEVQQGSLFVSATENKATNFDLKTTNTPSMVGGC